MGTINQPKPSEPKSPVHDSRPLQPGAVNPGPHISSPSSRVNSDAPEVFRDEMDQVEDIAHNRNEK